MVKFLKDDLLEAGSQLCGAEELQAASLCLGLILETLSEHRLFVKYVANA